MPETHEPLVVRVVIPGVVLPGWSVILLALCLVFSAAGFLLAYLQLKETAREIRVLQLHVQDVESVLIRQGVANRDDFAEWGRAPQRTRPPARESEE